jgi:DNA-binding transcriptional LysR family regulator
MDLDLRKLRYFAAVAELEHFGRAAEQLYIAQPVLSRQIRALEAELGCALLERTTRSVRLTEAGRQLYAEAPSVLAAAETLTRKVHRAARGAERLVLGFAPGLSVATLVREWASVRPGVELAVVQLNWWEQLDSVRDGRVDVGYLRTIGSPEGLRKIDVGSEPKVLCLPARHRLARRRKLRMADLAGESMLDVEARRLGTVEEKLQLVAAGEGLVLVPQSVANAYARPGLVYRPVVDGPHMHLSIAVASGRRPAHIEQFLALAGKILPDK